MPGFHSALIDFGSSANWLIAAWLVLSALVALAALRYRRLYRAARAGRARLADLIDNLSEGIYTSSLDGRQLSANKALVQLNGYSSEREMLARVKDIGTEWYVDPSRRAAFRDALERDGRVEDFVSEIYRHKTRERIWISESARLVLDPTTGNPLHYEGSVRDITVLVRRLSLEERFQKLTRELPGALFQLVTRASGVAEVLYVSAAFTRITGIPLEEFVERPRSLFGRVHGADISGLRRSLRRATEKRQSWDHEFRLRLRDGTEKWARVAATPEFREAGIIWHGYLTDISTRKSNEMEIERLAYFDPLTELPNRRMFLNRMAQAIVGSERRGDHGVLLFIDLDNFKTLNDTQGHDVGDAFLVQVAARLERCLAPRDLVARIGGDEFVVILEAAGVDEANATRHAIVVANRLLVTLREPFELAAVRHLASASVGVVVFDGAEARPDEILKRADIAMYQAKAAGRNGMALFDPASLERERERFRLVGDLRAALGGTELELHFQPQVDDRGVIIGAEGLLRWNHPRLGMIFPDRFIPLAEQFGLIEELSRAVFDLGLAALASWQRDPATAHLRLALNVSVQSFNCDSFGAMLGQMVRSHAVDATRLTLELTEHVMARDHERVARLMAEIKDLGVRLSLDDFGTGYSSLAYLKTLPFDELKIDGRFVADIETGESDRALVKTILAMARNLGLTSVAEHVENIRQQAFLRAFGCDCFQGYLYGKAVPAADFLDRLREGGTPQPATLRSGHPSRRDWIAS
ncbi:putative bifunctional diguanylate cyclase/phosphodiesterase [Mesorhizobium sp. L-8-3]|uniref:putative bifunctional diguanylate cyclase/phosphodiesterase n=1 Tax=Mesorhizobium sp. L-8-3 TaxID=2744522 RepID=UPI001927D3E5|nr:GGDEF domain-containing phosphodiesterase [Mesorhizobium sp. L-8-3]BCH25801.1 GGDEF domain-containing protein [Mesorhizobium sp. L-8-3]